MLAHVQQEPNEALAGATPYLRLFGLTTGGCLLAQQALAALRLTPMRLRALRSRVSSPRTLLSKRELLSARWSKAAGRDRSRSRIAAITCGFVKNNPMSTLLITHPACLNHLTPPGHPERPDRLRAIERALEAEKFQTLARAQAPIADLEMVALCHPMDYVTEVRDATPSEGIVRLDADTSMSPGSFEAAVRAVGGAVLAVDEVSQKRPPTPSSRRAHPVTTPKLPARWDFACLTTPRSPRATRRSVRYYACGIVDFDVHHGNGSQEIFWRTAQ